MPPPIGHTRAGCAVALTLIPSSVPRVWEVWVSLDHGTPGRGGLLGWPLSRRRAQAARTWFWASASQRPVRTSGQGSAVDLFCGDRVRGSAHGPRRHRAGIRQGWHGCLVSEDMP
jgi:hypothetical protein